MDPLYAYLLEKAPTLPEKLLRGATDVARARGDRYLAALLAASPELPADLDAVLTDIDQVQVPAARAQVAQTLRVGPSGNSPASTPAVLVKAMRDPHPDGRVVRHTISAFMSKPTRSLFKALIARPAEWFTPDECAALLRFACTYRDGLQAWDYLFAGFARRLNPDAAAELLLASVNTPSAETTVPPIGGAILCTPVGVDVVITYLRQAVTIVLDKPQWEQDRWVRQVRDATLRPNDEERHRIADAVGPIVADVPYLRHGVSWIRQQFDAPRGSMFQDWDTTPAAPPKASTGLTDAPLATRVAYAAQPDPALASAALDAALERGNLEDLADIAPALITNEHTSRDDIIKLLDALAQCPEVHCLTVYTGRYKLAGLDVVTMFPDDTEIIAAWCTLFPSEVYRRHGFAPFNTPIPELWDRWKAGEHYYAILTTVLQGRALTPDELLSTPVPVLRELLAQSTGAGFAVTVSRTLSKHLTTPAAVDIFGRLVDTFDGTLDELLSVASDLPD